MMLLAVVEELLRFVSTRAQSRSPLCVLLLDLSDCGFSPGMTPDDPFSVIHLRGSGGVAHADIGGAAPLSSARQKLK